MAIFEAGILTKMTEDEYEKLGKQQIIEKNLEGGDNSPSIAEKENRKIVEAVESRQKLKAINIRMLQGAFYVLFIGHIVAGKDNNIVNIINKYINIEKILFIIFFSFFSICGNCLR